MPPLVEHVRRSTALARVMSFALIGAGLVIAAVVIGLGAPLGIAGLGFALIVGGALGVWRAARVHREFDAAIADPERVLQLSPVSVNLRVNGLNAGTHAVLIVVFASGRHARLAGSALEAARAAFPRATVVTDREPYDRADTQSRLGFLGVAFAGLILGTVGAVLATVPRVNEELASIERWRTAIASEKALTEKALRAIDPNDSTAWSACASTTLAGEVPLRIEGVDEEPLVGSLTVGKDVFVTESFSPFFESRSTLTLDALTGSRLRRREAVAPQFAIAGKRVGEALVLRVVTSSGDLVCQGRATLEKGQGNAVVSAERAGVGQTIARPFCPQLAPRACADFPPLAVPIVADTTPAESARAAPREATTGSLSREAIQGVIRKNTAIQRCFEQALRKQPKLAGKVTVSFVIGAQGSVTSASVQNSTVSSTALERCVVDRVRSFRFPKPTGGAVAVAYPFVFAPN